MKTKLYGFVNKKQIHKNIIFLEVREKEKIYFVVAESKSKYFNKLKDIEKETYIYIEGKIVKSKSEKYSTEIQLTNLKIINKPNEAIPFEIEDVENVKEELYYNYRVLSIRNKSQMLLYKIWSSFDEYFQNYLNNEGYIKIHTPKILAEPSEGGSEVFEIKYFNHKAYLAQSPQFYKQLAICAGMSKVYEIGPAFRAENSNSPKHVTEFTSYDLEVANISKLKEFINLEKKLLIYVFKNIFNKYNKEIYKIYGFKIPKYNSNSFTEITFKECKEILKKQNVISENENDISETEEKEIGNYFSKKEIDFVFVTHYPIQKRAFYHKRVGNLTLGYDLIYKGVEITTCSLREEKYELLKKQAEERMSSIKGIQDYLNFFKYRVPKHGGMALGVERILMKYLNIESVKKVQLVCRTPNRINP